MEEINKVALMIRTLNYAALEEKNILSYEEASRLANDEVNRVVNRCKSVCW